jgi:hypothetical protein
LQILLKSVEIKRMGSVIHTLKDFHKWGMLPNTSISIGLKSSSKNGECSLSEVPSSTIRVALEIKSAPYPLSIFVLLRLELTKTSIFNPSRPIVLQGRIGSLGRFP